MAGVETGTVLAIATLASSVLIPLWVQLGKGRDNTLVHLVGERDRLDKRVAELERRDAEKSERLDRVEAEMEALRLDLRTLLDFLRDIISGRFDAEWIKGRAQDLLDRFGGGEKGGIPK